MAGMMMKARQVGNRSDFAARNRNRSVRQLKHMEGPAQLKNALAYTRSTQAETGTGLGYLASGGSAEQGIAIVRRMGDNVVQRCRENDDNPPNKPRFYVTPNQTILDANRDYNLVSTNVPANQGGDFFQIHNTHFHGNSANPHSHWPERHVDPETGRVNVNRVSAPTTAADIDYIDTAMRDGVLRERRNRRDQGGPE